MTKILGWHFVCDSRLLANVSPPMAVEPGYVYGEPEGDVVICRRGMHASRTVRDALRYAPGTQLCRVAVWGDVAEQSDKLVGRYREVLAMRDVASALRLWACWCVRTTILGDGCTAWELLKDPRSRAAVEVAERFARGAATRKELATAYAAATYAYADAATATAAGKYQADELERRMLALFGEVTR